MLILRIEGIVPSCTCLISLDLEPEIFRKPRQHTRRHTIRPRVRRDVVLINVAAGHANGCEISI